MIIRLEHNYTNGEKDSPWRNDEAKGAVKDKTNKMKKWLQRTLESRVEYMTAGNDCPKTVKKSMNDA